MMLRLFTTLAAASAVLANPRSRAQQAPAYRSFEDLHAPLTLPQPANSIRTGAGAPGPAFWQNRVDFNIEARIDTTAHVLTGDETVTYTNNSPEALDVLWFQMDQNLYRRDSRSGYAMVGRAADQSGAVDGRATEIETVSVDRGGKPVTLNFVVSDTRMRVDLPAAVKASGGQVKVHVRYHYTVPGLPWRRCTAWNANKSGDIYDIAQWYPHACRSIDDIRGWDTLPYLANRSSIWNTAPLPTTP